MKKIYMILYLFLTVLLFSAHYVEVHTVTATGIVLSITPYYSAVKAPKVYIYGPTGFVRAENIGNNIYEFEDGKFSWIVPIIFGENRFGQIVTGVLPTPIIDVYQYKKNVSVKVLTNPKDLSLTVKVDTDYDVVSGDIDGDKMILIKSDSGYILYTDKKRKEHQNILKITVKLDGKKSKDVTYKLFTLNGFTTYLRGDFTPYVFNKITTHVVKKGETLWEIAKKYGVRTADLQIINELDDPNKIYAGMRLDIGKVQFTEGLTSIVVNLATSRLAVYYAGKLVKIFPVAIGRSDSMPPGIYWIFDKQIDPALYWFGEYIPPRSPINGLGTRFLQLSNPKYGIHGTTKPWEIGRRISHGCVRMFNRDVETLDSFVDLGSPVFVVKNFKDFPENLSNIPEFVKFKIQTKKIKNREDKGG
ncbi:hypothetical protein BG95_06195 [Thermosipho sp. 1063]|nr:hypothetical protein Y592_06270 [Thermosipho sp. 1070]APT72451.1 hypothetical protein BG95_06195 [Thermosipho sp. 1063]